MVAFCDVLKDVESKIRSGRKKGLISEDCYLLIEQQVLRAKAIRKRAKDSNDKDSKSRSYSRALNEIWFALNLLVFTHRIKPVEIKAIPHEGTWLLTESEKIYYPSDIQTESAMNVLHKGLTDAAKNT